MFNWFKSKVELKNTTSTMSSSHNKKGLKLGSEIIVPNGFKCLVFHKGKCFNTLNEGKYKVDKQTFINLIDYQQKLKHKLKYVKCVCHYISVSPQKLEIKFKKKIFIVEFLIKDTIKFADLALLYAYKVDNDYVLNTLNDMFYELLAYVKGDYKQINTSSLEKYGININSFELKGSKSSIFNRHQKKDARSNNEHIINDQAKADTTLLVNGKVENAQNLSTPSNDESNSSNSEDKSIQNQSSANTQSQFPACPKCNNITKFNTTYCLRCGYKLQ